MAQVKFRYVQSFLDRHGVQRHYLRYPNASRVRLPDDIASPEFEQAYVKALTKVEAQLGDKLGASYLHVDSAHNEAMPTAGVYLLLQGEKITYVGTSGNMRKRVAKHRSNGREFDRVFCIPASNEDRALLERALIPNYPFDKVCR